MDDADRRTGVGPVSGATRTAGVIGWPVEHSRSPAIHNAGYAALGLDWRYLAFPVPPGRARDAVVGAGALGMAGLSVTMPHKASVAAVVDAVSADAVALGSVNTVTFEHGRSIGFSTDGDGFIDSLHDAAVDPAGARCVVLGAGGAARAVARALARAQAAEVVVVNRRAERARRAAQLAGPVGRVGDATDLGAAELVVNATPVGMGDSGEMPIEPEALGDGCIVADLVYHPLETPLLAASAARGLPTIDGLGMLVHQAARQFEAWTGLRPPIAALRSAASIA